MVGNDSEETQKPYFIPKLTRFLFPQTDGISHSDWHCTLKPGPSTGKLFHLGSKLLEDCASLQPAAYCHRPDNVRRRLFRNIFCEKQSTCIYAKKDQTISDSSPPIISAFVTAFTAQCWHTALAQGSPREPEDQLPS